MAVPALSAALARIVFAGAGHAHLHALARAAEYVAAGHEPVLVAPGPFWYSGMGPGLLSGVYRPEDDRLDAGGLVESGGGRYLRDRIARIDPGRRRLELAAGGTLDYDLLSLNLGSEVPLDVVPGAREHAVPVKPVRHLAELRTRLAAAKVPQRLVVIGGGAAGCEVAANALRLARDERLELRLTLVSASGRLLEGVASRAGDFLHRWLSRRGVALRLGATVRRVAPGAITLEEGETVPADVVVMATGVRPPAVLRESGFETARDGAAIVDDRLRSVSHAEVFGGGDCITPRRRPLDRVGIYAVRQAPVLHHNLLAAAAGEPLRRFRPQRRYLLILNLGDGTGLLLRGRLVLHGRWVFRLKDRLDRSFVRRYRRTGL